MNVECYESDTYQHSVPFNYGFIELRGGNLLNNKTRGVVNNPHHFRPFRRSSVVNF